MTLLYLFIPNVVIIFVLCAFKKDEPNNANPKVKKLPFLKRIHRKYLLRFASRWPSNHEWEVRINEESKEVEFSFYIARKPVAFSLFMTSGQEFSIEGYKYQSENKWISDSFGVVYSQEGNLVFARIYPFKIESTEKARIKIDGLTQHLQQCQVRVLKQPYADFDFVNSAVQLRESGELEKASVMLEEYCKLVDNNPHVFFDLSLLYLELKRYPEAEKYALKAVVCGHSTKSQALYRKIQSYDPYLELKVIENLRKQGQKWKLENTHGTVALKFEQKFLLGINGWYLLKCREVLEVRRPVAARRLTRLYFPYKTNDWLLLTNLRIIHKKNEINEIPPEHFVVETDSDRATHREKRGVWILPELSAGDIIEWSYHILQIEYTAINNLPHFFIAALPHDEFFPTLSGTVDFKVPKNWKIKFAGNNKELESTKQSKNDDEWQIHTFKINEYIPICGTGFGYEVYHLNPAVACGYESHSWKDVSKVILKNEFGEMDFDDELPSTIENLLRQHQNPEKALQQAFYWIRDKLKYRPFDRSVIERAHKGWAKKIIESGVANCRDKSYLLYQICRRLGFKSEPVMFSTDSGFLFEELPADQFDHVFVRVQINGDWRYLDATYSYALFGSTPTWCQDLKTQVLDDQGSIIKIPEDQPEKNRVLICETFGETEANWLSGRFAVRAQGFTARHADEYWKGLSLQMRAHKHSAQEALRRYMPSLMLKNYARSSNTSNSDILEVSGRHNRCQLSILKDKTIGTLGWQEPALGIDTWSLLHKDKIFVFYSPMIIEIELTFFGQLFKSLEAISRDVELENEICQISAERSEQDDCIQLKRRIVIKKKFVKGKDLELMPQVIESLEKALQVAVSFSKV